MPNRSAEEYYEPRGSGAECWGRAEPGRFLRTIADSRAVSRALERAFAVLTLPGVVARALLQRACNRLLLPSVDALEAGEVELPYAGLVAAQAVPALVLTAAGVVAFARSASAAVEGVAELASVWLGLSLVVHAWPGAGATAALYGRSFEADSTWRWLGLPLALLGRLFERLRVVWLDLVYGLLVFVVVRAVV